MDDKKQYNIMLTLGLITFMIFSVSAGLIYNTVGLVQNMVNSQSLEEVQAMKNSNDGILLENLREDFQQQDSVIYTSKGIITIQRQVNYKEFSYTTVWYSVSILIINIIYTAFLLWVLILIRRVLSSAFESKIFIRKNVKRIHKISWLFILFAAFLIFEGLFSNLYFSYFFNSSIDRPIIEIDFITIGRLLFLVIVVYGLSEVFRLGVKLKEENDLTV